MIDIRSGLEILMTTGARRGRALRRYVLPMLVIAVLGLLVPGVSPANASGSGFQTSQHTSATSLLAAKWWQWALTQPGSKSPLTDTTGQFCGQGQRGNVWFLAGNFGGQPSSPINRSCTIPGGKDLFFPLVNQFSGYQVGVDPLAAASVTAQRAIVDASQVQNSTGLSVTVDRRPAKFEFEKSVPFVVVLPRSDNLFGLTDHLLLVPTVDAGYYAYVKALRPGPHTIAFTGTQPGQDPIAVTYQLSVGR